MQLIFIGEERVRMTERERINAVTISRFYLDTHLAAGYDFRLPKMDLYLPRGLSGRSSAMNVLYDFYWLERRRIKYALDDCVLNWYEETTASKYRYTESESKIITGPETVTFRVADRKKLLGRPSGHLIIDEDAWKEGI